MSRLSFVFAPILIASLLTTVLGQASPPQNSQPRKAVSRASWSPSLGVLGISEQDFQDMGLGTLTKEQVGALLTWAAAREQQARDSVLKPSFPECGRLGAPFKDAKPDSYDNVRIYVTASGDADEVISGVRARFRAMNGIEVVYSRDEADLTVSLVGMVPTHLGTSVKMDSVVFSVLISQPCIFKWGTYTNSYDTVEDQFV